jgi:hypothetical protein
MLLSMGTGSIPIAVPVALRRDGVAGIDMRISFSMSRRNAASSASQSRSQDEGSVGSECQAQEQRDNVYVDPHMYKPYFCTAN